MALWPIDAELIGQRVHHRFVGDGGLQTKPRKKMAAAIGEEARPASQLGTA
jgi:hypothetical protein